MNRIDAGKVIIGGELISSKPEKEKSEHNFRSAYSIPPATLEDHRAVREEEAAVVRGPAPDALIVKKGKKRSYASDMYSLDDE